MLDVAQTYQTASRLGACRLPVQSTCTFIVDYCYGIGSEPVQAKSSITRKIIVYFLLMRQTCVLDNLLIDFNVKKSHHICGPIRKRSLTVFLHFWSALSSGSCMLFTDQLFLSLRLQRTVRNRGGGGQQFFWERDK